MDIDWTFAPLGLFAGVLLWSRVVHICLAVWSALSKTDTVESLKKSPTESQVRTLLIAGFSSVMIWILAFATTAWHSGSTATQSAGWAWFWGGVAAGPVPAILLTIRAVRRMRERGQIRPDASSTAG